jgi:hypothetical protein
VSDGLIVIRYPSDDLSNALAVKGNDYFRQLANQVRRKCYQIFFAERDETLFLC